MQMSRNTVLVTGGGSGIGRRLAEEFSALGNRVVIADRGDTDVSELLAAHPDMRSVELDQADPASVAEFSERVKREHPDLNVLINDAGIQRPEDLTKGETAEAVAQISTNLLGPIRVTASLIRGLLQKPHAAIINVSSGLGFLPSAAVPTYCATKAAIHAYTLGLRFQLRETTVQVIEIIPPMVQTNLQRPEDRNQPAAMPVEAFVSEGMDLLTRTPDSDEIVVDRVKSFRFAERNGTFDKAFTEFNERVVQSQRR